MIVPDKISPVEATQHVLPRPNQRIGGILVEEGKLSAGDVKRILELQHAEGLRFGEAALRLGLITVDDLRSAVARQYDLPHLLPDNERVSRELVVAYDPFHRCAEQIRALRTQLLIRWTIAGVRQRILAIVSPGLGEGRSYVTANLAVAFAQLGNRTLLIDADLRRPRQQEIFAAADHVGLAAVLSGRTDGKAAVVPIPEFGKLSLLPAGARPPNPMELLSRDTLPALLHELKNEFEVILLDTPAATLCADALTVAFRAGMALVLARKDHTPSAATDGVIRELSDAGISIVGSVFNAFGSGLLANGPAGMLAGLNARLPLLRKP